LIGATHFYCVATKPSEEYNNRIKNATNGAEEIFKIVSKINNDLPMKTIRPSHITSTDDIATWYLDTIKQEDPSFYLVHKSSLNRAGTRSNFTSNGESQCDGIRCKFTHTFTMSGISADIFISIAGLSDYELPKNVTPEGILLLEVEGLSIGGGGISVNDRRNGFVCLMRKEKDIDVARYNIYRNHVFLPFVHHIRQTLDDWNGDIDSLLPKMKIVSWQDGDIGQIKSIVTNIEIYNKYDIIANKHSPARTAVEQAADVGKCFKQFHNAAGKITCNTPDDNPLYKQLKKSFMALEKEQKLKLSYKKSKALLDLLTCAPSIYYKAITSNGICHGAINNGMIDSKIYQFPCLSAMMSTLGHHPTQQEYDIITKSLPILILEMQEKGHVSESTFDQLGFPMDERTNGEIFEQNATITQEHLQRAKSFTHHFQNNERLKIKQQINLKKQQQNEKIEARQQHQIKLSRECVVRILNKKMKNSKLTYPLDSLENATLQHVAAAKKDMLKAFLSVRKIQHSSELSKENLVKLVHQYRMIEEIEIMNQNIESDEENEVINEQATQQQTTSIV